MTLNQYIRESSDTAEALAERLNISVASVSRIRNGKQNITLALARLIVSETQGLVTLDDLVVHADAA